MLWAHIHERNDKNIDIYRHSFNCMQKVSLLVTEAYKDAHQKSVRVRIHVVLGTIDQSEFLSFPFPS